MTASKILITAPEPPTVTKRFRSATRRVPNRPDFQDRLSFIERVSQSRTTVEHIKQKFYSKESRTSGSSHTNSKKSTGRRIFFNLALPDDSRDANGLPRTTYPRNKIRTAKYTPLTFLPKNLWFQFHNVANIYFLFIVILGAFSVFGVINPALNSIPLLVILAVTALKDGIEDWRRTALDSKLNNAPVYRLVNYHNVNTAEDKVSLWRQFKKANTRLIVSIYRFWKSRRYQTSQGSFFLKEHRMSVDTRPGSQVTHRTSYHSALSNVKESIAMQSLQNNLPLGQDVFHDAVSPTANVISSKGSLSLLSPREKIEPVSPSMFTRARGSIINPHRPTTGIPRFKRDYWKNVRVGDFVRLYNGDQVPADIVVLSTSESDGVCYIETQNLDGETNLKVRHSLFCSRDVRHARQCEQTEFYIDSEGPQPNLYSYNGVIHWEQHDLHNKVSPPVSMSEPIGIDNLLLRGCTMRNTEWVLGVVVFTGSETKIMLNSGITPSKRAKISKELNRNVIYNFILLFIICLIVAIAQGVIWSEGGRSQNFFDYGSYGNSPAMNGFLTFWAGIILFQSLTPISLYITLEIIRSFQALFIYNDVQMYYEELDYPCTPKSWNISDDLGQIEYIFSDKTGTLTQNVMEFKMATINGIAYGEAYTEAQAGNQRRLGMDVDVERAKASLYIAQVREKMIEGLRQLHKNPYFYPENLTFVAADFVDDLNGASGPEQATAIYQFMLSIALCHTVIATKTGGEHPTIEFKSQSPDETALVSTARDCGFTVLGRVDDGVIVNVLGRETKFTVLNTLEFNSSRKRMSAIIQMPDSRIVLICKGADSVIYSRLKPNVQSELRHTTAEQLEMFAREGLRTLCIAKRELTAQEYREWSHEHDLAASSLTDREQKLDAVADRIERELILLGGTAIEDRLQEGISESLSLLGTAGLKLWVLTGDKAETAINIGFSCNLLDTGMDLIVLKVEDDKHETAAELLDRHLASFGLTGSLEELALAKHQHDTTGSSHAIVVDGDALKFMLDDSLKNKFLLLGTRCRSVLCCRVSPAQKAQVVRLVKDGLDCLTLAIGDGANDVAMIQEAHVGVGIAGEEGRQAVMSSDYAIGQFRYLTRLLLVHGRWSYRRLAETISIFFYKNVIWTFALFWYNIYSNFDCPNVFDYTYIILYNLAFTSLPVIFLGILDQDVDDIVSLAVPQLYRRGMEGKEWTETKFWGYMIDGVYQSLILYFFAYLIFAPATFASDNGLDIGDTKRFGVFIATTAVIVANLFLLMNVLRWDWLQVTVVMLSMTLIFLWTIIYTSLLVSQMFYQAANQVYGNLTFWLMMIVTVIACLLPRFILMYTQKMFFPRDVDIIREQLYNGQFVYPKSHSSSPAGSESSVSPSTNAPRVAAPILTVTTDATCENEHSDIFEAHKHSILPTSEDDISSLHSPGRMSLQRKSFVGAFDDQRLHGSSEGGRDRLSHGSLLSPRLSSDRGRPSVDRLRPSFETSSDFTSAALLSRIESTRSSNNGPG